MLGITVKKVAGDMGLRRRLVAAAAAAAGTDGGFTVPPPPSWAVWKDEKTPSKTLTAQATRHAALESMRALEGQVTAEIGSSTAAELKLCERKLAMLRVKRQEETELRHAALRKAQRQHDKAEAQRLDPKLRLRAGAGEGR